MHWVERLKVSHLVAGQRAIVRKGTEDGQVDRVVVVGARRQRGSEDHVLGADAVDAERYAQGERVLGQGARLVGAQHVHTGEFLDGDQLADDRLLLGEQSSPPDSHRHRQHRGHRYRNGRHGQHQRELQGGEHGVAAHQGGGHDHRDEGDRKKDQVVADLEDCALEVADGVRILDQLGGLTEIGASSGGIHQSADLAAADDGAGEHGCTGLRADRQ